MTSSQVPPYGVLHDAMASGDIDKMRKAADEAEAHLREFGDIGRLLKILRQEIARLEGPQRWGAADMPPYGDSMRAAFHSGDLDRMRHMIEVAEDWLGRAVDVQNALVDLKLEVSKRSQMDI